MRQVLGLCVLLIVGCGKEKSLDGAAPAGSPTLVRQAAAFDKSSPALTLAWLADENERLAATVKPGNLMDQERAKKGLRTIVTGLAGRSIQWPVKVNHIEPTGECPIRRVERESPVARDEAGDLIRHHNLLVIPDGTRLLMDIMPVTPDHGFVDPELAAGDIVVLTGTIAKSDVAIRDWSVLRKDGSTMYHKAWDVVVWVRDGKLSK